jgi:ubiquitin-like modifier-activating enzyme ATG7
LRREARVPGVLRNVNTDEAFRRVDKQGWLQELGDQIWADIHSGAAVSEPGKLARFAVLCFADIKRNAFLYWFAFPAITSAPPFRHLRPPTPVAGPGGFFSDAECLLLQNGLKAFRRLRLEKEKEKGGGPYCPPFFLLLRSLTAAGSAASLSLEVAPLDAYDGLSDAQRRDCLFAFLDPGTVPLAPAWPLRNFLLLLANRWGLRSAAVLCYRGRLGVEAVSASCPAEAARAVGSSFLLNAELSPLAQPEKRGTTGWERNRGRFMPRRVDLSGMMDPIKLAEASVDLNLKLMRWRLLPALDAPRLAATRCLLLGAGTLGCGVARCLLGWGVRTITLVDNGRVALSNPVRQSLFEYADCLDGGKPKAAAAAAALKRIFPGVVAEGHAMTIPMPGHPLAAGAEAEAAARDVAQLDALVQAHDVVFLLTDTRESRWLPTVLAAAHDKLLLNAALGFDTFLVMRHGGSPEGNAERIGCYFCNDVVAPEDSTKDRTLDQQCTVTRPGLAQVASALAVELMVALRHHPGGHRAPADSEVRGKGAQGGGKGGAVGRCLRAYIPTDSHTHTRLRTRRAMVIWAGWRTLNGRWAFSRSRSADSSATSRRSCPSRAPSTSAWL